MGKADKVKIEAAGRVPLVQGGKPLLYPRYISVEDLMKIGKCDEAAGAAVNGTGDGSERPSKKQKRSAAVTRGAEGTSGDEQAEPAPKPSKYAEVGEDGLTYKQRRQQQRAAERAAKAQAEAETQAAAAAAAPAADGAEGNGAVANGSAPEPSTAPSEGAAEGAGKDKKKKKKGKRDRVADGEAVAAGPGGAAKAVGNADEAARMRAVLGFSAAGAAGGAGLSLAALAAPSASAAAAATVSAAAADGADADGAGEGQAEGSERKKSKKDKMAAEAGRAQELEQAGAAAAAEPAAQPVAADAAAVAASAAAPGARAGKPARGAWGQFSFDFKVQAEVEAETEAKVARMMALDASKDGFVPRRVWVSGLPHEFDEAAVREYWGYCGELEDLHMMAFPDSGNFNGTAFITFKTQEGYESALACHGEMLEGRALRVEKCKAAAELKGKARQGGQGGAAAPASRQQGGSGGSGAPGGRVAGYPVAYVGNIAFEAGAEEVTQLFAGAGAVPTKVRLHTDKASGRSKGFAHVHFGSDEDVDTAMALDGTIFHGRKIRVSYAQPKPGEVA